MAGIDWLRLWHDMPNDPKWRTIARISKQRIGDVISIYVHVLVIASSDKDRGSLASLRAEDVASALDLETSDVEAVLDAMSGRVIEDGRVAGWNARQPQVEQGATGTRGSATVDNYVYFVGTTSGVVKIGISRNPWARVKDLQVGSSDTFSLLAVVKTPRRSEAELHALFKRSHARGEWFHRSQALDSLIDQVKSKSLGTYDECISYLATLDDCSYSPITTVATEATKDKEKSREDKSNTSTNVEVVANHADDQSDQRPKLTKPQCPHQEIIALYHELLPANPSIRDWTPSRAEHLRVRWNEDAKRQTLDWWRRFFLYIGESAFLTGRATSKDRKPFAPGLDWIVKAENFTKIREGRYHEQEAA